MPISVKSTRHRTPPASSNDHMLVESWPAAGKALLGELRAYPGRLALIADNQASHATVHAFAGLMGSSPMNVGQMVLVEPVPASVDEIIERLASAQILVALDVLFWRPWLALDPLRLLRMLARRSPPVMALWPGDISGSSLTYSAAGRPDFFAAALEDALVLRPTEVGYPDEVPYELERR
jgi:hypothetical protein